MAKINHKALAAEIAQKGYKIFKPLVVERVERILRRRQKELMVNFESSPITIELESGPQSSNTSGALGGVGNLYTFLGFDRGSDPISPLRNLLAQSIYIVSIRKKRNELALRLVFHLPTEEEIAAVTGLPWAEGDSWTAALERGISNLGQTLFKSGAGKSGGAIQADGEVRSVSSSIPVDYLTRMLNELQAGVEKSLKRL